MAGLELRNVVKRFGEVTVVQQMDLAIHEGEFVVLLGESGCGKSTTLRMIAGLEEVTQGQILIGDRDVTHAAPMDRDIAMVFQNYALYPHMNVAENMSFALRLSGRPYAEIFEKVRSAARILSIEHLLERKPRELSGGQRQRVAIGRAIVREPKVFLFDEPLSNLDAKLRGHMRAELAILHERLGKTTVYVTHDQVEAMTLASRIVIFDKGEIQQIGTPSDVFTRPASLFVAGFIGTPTMNFFRARYSQEHGLKLLRGEGFAWIAPDWLVAQAPRADQSLTLGLRPQALHPSNAGVSLLSLQVDVVEYLGTESQVVGHMNTPSGQRVAAMLPGNAQDRLRQRVDLSFDPQDMHVFDTASGRSLRP
ncbi:sn-glycerol-3-phosphate ABC transporter ATP-binding protein UgpC [Acidovorax sp. sif1233]|uniref:ABC transporter ATP-binding protein n=1 Tax=unclassified Acidovorax TaxID=2684926 RepID=UPI001C455AD1|nr:MULTISPECIES: sn-glycerol-3-phosphate ABC transporter ATP-binding protein UgpC [unclassified Acidovorax]MBV7427928.1 sn-glycerol-3-phosphate ABC transporter ATP-binding protein UgpC [Acidovorax sp. sif0732]MBV7449185.1 sn-glycerol-3-phosphate ABC transporter ATP-binding protein UgpC [Acidovorax sp. sif0715]MBV7455701.1 sn-glycerol-3-phosphate ABC transporter ATP-binding protein UgpC [Acidovorax sp. sif1233]